MVNLLRIMAILSNNKRSPVTFAGGNEGLSVMCGKTEVKFVMEKKLLGVSLVVSGDNNDEFGGMRGGIGRKDKVTA